MGHEPDVRVLGTVVMSGPRGRAQLAGARQRAVVGVLALKVGDVVPGWRLVEALWGDDPPRTAVRSLHSHVARVRQALDACGLPDALAAYLREGLDLWRHEVALADAEPTGWGAAEVDRLAELRLAATEDRWEAELRLGRHAAALDELERLLVDHPLREPLVGLLMRALCRAGRYTAALEAYQRLRVRLADELGVDPGPALVDLHTRILRRDPSLGSAPEPSPETAPEPAGDEIAPAMPAPAQLPARVGHFTGRAPELAALDRLVELAEESVDDAEPHEDLRIAMISGPAGMGKTALAVQWAHRVAGRFPDGQLFLDLRGHDPRAALTPSVALSHLLRSLGVPAERIPTDLAEQAALYRSLLHGKRMLVVLDNAGHTEDILPLVPASAGNLLLVTSRNAMTALATHHAVCPVGVDEFAEDEALALLAKVLGQEVVERDPHASAELARQCGRMPLALRIAAAKLAAQPRRTIRDLTQDLAGADRLDLLSVDGDSRSVRAVFVSAYEVLSATGARLFRLLGLHPGQTFSPHAAAAVADLTVGAARQAVDEPSPMRADAAGRLVDWYLTVVDAANRAVHPGRDRVTPAPRYRPAETPFRPDHHAALAFLDGERGNLLPLVRYAVEQGHEEAAWQLTYLLAGFYESRGDRDERVELCRLGLAAARRAGDASAEGLMLSGLGVAMIAAHRHDEALDRLREALPLMRASGDQRGEGHVHNNIAVVHSGLGRFEPAIEAFRAALAIHTANGYRLGVALALNNIGHTYVRMGKPELGFADLVKALAMFREIDNPRLEASALHSLGEASLGLGDTRAALDHLGGALEICRRIGNRRDEAAMLNSLGAVHLRRSDHAAALARFDQARLLVRELADEHLEAITLNHAGEAYLRMGDLAAAQRRLGRALALRARIPDPLEAAHLQRNLAELERRSCHPIAAATTARRTSTASGLTPASPRPEVAPRP